MVTINAANEPTAASGKVLQGQGIGTASSFSTATYPSTATGTGTILRADGTNWSATTATYPNTGGTSLNLLQSDGTNFVSTAPIIYRASGTISNATFKALHSTPLTLVAAPAAGKFLQIIGFSMRLNYGGNNAFVSGGNLIVQYSGTAISPISIGTTSYTGTVTSVTTPLTPASSASVLASASTTGVALLLTTATSDPSGNAANDNTVDYSFIYTINF